MPDAIALEPEPPGPWWWVFKGLCLLCDSPGKAVWNPEAYIQSGYVQGIYRSEVSEEVLLPFTFASFLHHKVTYLPGTVALKGFSEAVLICAGAVKPLEVILVCIELLDQVNKFFVGVLEFFHLQVQFLLAEAVLADLSYPLREYLHLLPVELFGEGNEPGVVNIRQRGKTIANNRCSAYTGTPLETLEDLIRDYQFCLCRLFYHRRISLCQIIIRFTPLLPEFCHPDEVRLDLLQEFLCLKGCIYKVCHQSPYKVTGNLEFVSPLNNLLLQDLTCPLQVWL